MGLLKTPKLTKGNFWWFIRELGAWYAASGGVDFKNFILKIADSLAETNEEFKYDYFVTHAFKHYNLD